MSASRLNQACKCMLHHNDVTVPTPGSGLKSASLVPNLAEVSCNKQHAKVLEKDFKNAGAMCRFLKGLFVHQLPYIRSSPLLLTFVIRTKSHSPNPDMTVLEFMEGCKCILAPPSSTTSATPSPTTTTHRKKKKHSATATPTDADVSATDIATTTATVTTAPSFSCPAANATIALTNEDQKGNGTIKYTQVMSSSQHYYSPWQNPTTNKIAFPATGPLSVIATECAEFAIEAYLGQNSWVEIVNTNSSDDTAWTCLFLYSPVWNPTLGEWTEEEDFGCSFVWQLDELKLPDAPATYSACPSATATFTGTANMSTSVRTMSYTQALAVQNSDIQLTTADVFTILSASQPLAALSSCADLAAGAYNGTDLDFMVYNIQTNQQFNQEYICAVYDDAGGDLVGEATYRELIDCAWVYQHA
ncbi:hypothetical protein ANO11243_027220 [Dothideomycetidae sp. 11243]|nr:hypothetical protein ANO11243_027220 [fungal sp. No.11243]